MPAPLSLLGIPVDLYLAPMRVRGCECFEISFVSRAHPSRTPRRAARGNSGSHSQRRIPLPAPASDANWTGTKITHRADWPDDGYEDLIALLVACWGRLAWREASCSGSASVAVDSDPAAPTLR
jgi:hypothetical protein